MILENYPLKYETIYQEAECARCTRTGRLDEMVFDHHDFPYCSKFCRSAALSLEVAYQEALRK